MMNHVRQRMTRLAVVIAISFGLGWRVGTPAVAGDPAEDKKVDARSVQREIERVMDEADDALRKSGLNEEIRIFQSAADKLHPRASKLKDLEVWYGMSGIYNCLQEDYALVAKYEQAEGANALDYEYLCKILAEDVGWIPMEARPHEPNAPPPDGLPIPYNIFENRRGNAFLVHARLGANLDAKTRADVRNVIKAGADALLLSKLKGEDAAEATMNLSLTYWTNGNLVEAEAAIISALDHAGPAGPAKTETKWRREFFGKSYLIHASLLVEQRNFEKVLKLVDKASEYLQDHSDPNGMLGFEYVLLARVAPSPAATKSTLDKAIHHLEQSDKCATCLYTLACALGKKAQLVPEPERTKLIDEANCLCLGTLADAFDRTLPSCHFQRPIPSTRGRSTGG